MRRAARRRRLSLTALVDVIFLLLLFFMLGSTFTRFGEVDLDTGTARGSGGAAPDAPPPFFLRLGSETMDLNGTPLALGALPAALADAPAPALLVALRPGVSAQRLTDLMVVLRQVPGARATVLAAAP